MIEYRCIKCSGKVIQQKPPAREQCDHCKQYTDNIFGIQLIFECQDCREIYQPDFPLYSSADPRPCFMLEEFEK